MNLYLIGYRCTGKTTVGKALARRLGWVFFDTDSMIVEDAGISIAQMVASRGWPYFREQERHALETVACRDCRVVATGGGIILDGRNTAIMKKTGTVVWLKARQETIAARMLTDDATAGNRPSLTDQGLIGEIAPVLAERGPYYEKPADLVIDTDRETIETIGDRIMEKLRIKECGN